MKRLIIIFLLFSCSEEKKIILPLSIEIVSVKEFFMDQDINRVEFEILAQGSTGIISLTFIEFPYTNQTPHISIIAYNELEVVNEIFISRSFSSTKEYLFKVTDFYGNTEEKRWAYSF